MVAAFAFRAQDLRIERRPQTRGLIARYRECQVANSQSLKAAVDATKIQIHGFLGETRAPLN
jgi:hypothetical protein